MLLLLGIIVIVTVVVIFVLMKTASTTDPTTTQIEAPKNETKTVSQESKYNETVSLLSEMSSSQRAKSSK